MAKAKSTEEKVEAIEDGIEREVPETVDAIDHPTILKGKKAEGLATIDIHDGVTIQYDPERSNPPAPYVKREFAG